MKILDFLGSKIEVKNSWNDVTLMQFVHLSDPNPLDFDEPPGDLFKLQWKFACLTNLTLSDIEKLSLEQFEQLAQLIKPEISFYDHPCPELPIRTFKHVWDWDDTGYPYPRYFEMQQTFDTEPFGKYMLTIDLSKKIKKEQLSFEDEIALTIATVFHEIKKPSIFQKAAGLGSTVIYDADKIDSYRRAFLHLPHPVAMGAVAFFLKKCEDSKKDTNQYSKETRKEATQKSSSPKNSE